MFNGSSINVMIKRMLSEKPKDISEKV